MKLYIRHFYICRGALKVGDKLLIHDGKGNEMHGVVANIDEDLLHDKYTVRVGGRLVEFLDLKNPIVQEDSHTLSTIIDVVEKKKVEAVQSRMQL